MNEFYMDDVYEEPFHIAFNFPEGTTPYNGIVLPDQTSPSRYLDYFALPEDGMARTICDKQEKNFEEYTLYLSPFLWFQIPLPIRSTGYSWNSLNGPIF